MKPSPLFTVLLPVHRPPDLIPYAIKTVLSQSLAAFELFVLCDGAPAATIACATEWAQRDPRVRVFDFPKGERHGEAHRHELLMQAKAPLVAYLADDDLWFPNHLQEMAALLQEVDFGNVLQTHIHENNIHVFVGHLENAYTIEQMQQGKYNFFGPTTAGHRLSAYKSLPQGWTPAPNDIPTDLFMWQKFLAAPELKKGTRLSVTSLHFATSLRENFSVESRIAELGTWYTKISSPIERDIITQGALKAVMENACAYRQSLPILQKAPLLTAELQTITGKLTTLHETNHALKRELILLSQSLSWALTKPLRFCKKILIRLLRAI